MVRKDKHIRIAAAVINAMDAYADKSLRTKTVVYETALKFYLAQKKNEIIDTGVPKHLIEDALENGDKKA